MTFKYAYIYICVLVRHAYTYIKIGGKWKAIPRMEAMVVWGKHHPLRVAAFLCHCSD